MHEQMIRKKIKTSINFAHTVHKMDMHFISILIIHLRSDANYVYSMIGPKQKWKIILNLKIQLLTTRE